MDSEGNRLNGTVVEVKDRSCYCRHESSVSRCRFDFYRSGNQSRLATNEELQGMVNMMSGEGGCDAVAPDAVVAMKKVAVAGESKRPKRWLRMRRGSSMAVTNQISYAI